MPPLFQSYNTISLAVHAQLDSVLRLWQRRLGPDLLAVYLHGSLSLGRFQEENGDLDLLVLTARKLPREERLSLARDLLGEAGAAPDALGKKGRRFFVTPESIDQRIRDLSKVLGYGIDLALQETLELEDLEALLA